MKKIFLIFLILTSALYCQFGSAGHGVPKGNMRFENYDTNNTGNMVDLAAYASNVAPGITNLFATIIYVTNQSNNIMVYVTNQSNNIIVYVVGSTNALDTDLRIFITNQVIYLRVDGTLAMTGSFNLDTNDITNVQNLHFVSNPPPAYAEGVLFYDGIDKILSWYNDEAEVTHNIGDELWVRVRNSSGATITNGKIVFVDGSTGMLPTIELAKASETQLSKVIGVATHDIENNSIGYVTTTGLVRNIKTDDFADGDEVFLSATVAGEFTNIIPINPNVGVQVGIIVKSHVTQGKLLVNISYRETANFTEGSLVFADSTNRLIQDNANLFWDNASNRLGIGTNAPQQTLHIVGDVGVIGDIIGDGSGLLSNIGGIHLTTGGITNENGWQISDGVGLNFEDSIGFHVDGSDGLEFENALGFHIDSTGLFFENAVGFTWDSSGINMLSGGGDIILDGSGILTNAGAIFLDQGLISGVLDPVATNDGANKQYIDTFPSYAEMWARNNQSYSMATAGTYYVLTNLTAGYEKGDITYIAVTNADGTFTIGADGVGLYKITVTLSFGGTINTVFSNNIFTNGVIVDNLCSLHKVGTGGDSVDTTISGFIQLEDGDLIDTRSAADGNTKTLALECMNFTIVRIKRD